MSLSHYFFTKLKSDDQAFSKSEFESENVGVTLYGGWRFHLWNINLHLINTALNLTGFPASALVWVHISGEI